MWPSNNILFYNDMSIELHAHFLLLKMSAWIEEDDQSEVDKPDADHNEVDSVNNNCCYVTASVTGRVHCTYNLHYTLLLSICGYGTGGAGINNDIMC